MVTAPVIQETYRPDALDDWVSRICRMGGAKGKFCVGARFGILNPPASRLSPRSASAVCALTQDPWRHRRLWRGLAMQLMVFPIAPQWLAHSRYILALRHDLARAWRGGRWL